LEHESRKGIEQLVGRATKKRLIGRTSVPRTGLEAKKKRKVRGFGAWIGGTCSPEQKDHYVQGLGMKLPRKNVRKGLQKG